jgi:hypothetical protein
MKDLEEQIEWTMKYCQHYDASGITMIGGKEPHGCCKAGVNYLDQFGRADPNDPVSQLDGRYYERAGIFKRIICTSGGARSEEEQLKLCPKWLRATREQGIARHKEIEDVLTRMRIVGPIVAEWRKKLPRGKQETIECPVCKGRLHLSQAAYNGHVHGHCSTPDCVSWME